MAITVPTDAYCELSDVRGLLPNRVFSSATTPTETAAEATIKAVADEMNARIAGCGYGTPVTNTTALRLLKRINARGAAYEIECQIQNGRTDQLLGSGKEYGRQYERDLKAIAADELKLGSLAQATVPTGQSAFYPSGTAPAPRITRDMEF